MGGAKQSTGLARFTRQAATDRAGGGGTNTSRARAGGTKLTSVGAPVVGCPVGWAVPATWHEPCAHSQEGGLHSFFFVAAEQSSWRALVVARRSKISGAEAPPAAAPHAHAETSQQRTEGSSEQ